MNQEGVMDVNGILFIYLIDVSMRPIMGVTNVWSKIIVNQCAFVLLSHRLYVKELLFNRDRSKLFLSGILICSEYTEPCIQTMPLHILICRIAEGADRVKMRPHCSCS